MYAEKDLRGNTLLGYDRSMTATTEKRRVGRPRSGRLQVVSLKLPAELIRAVDGVARLAGESKSEMMRRAIEEMVKRYRAGDLFAGDAMREESEPKEGK
jgi:hypothetical protein